MRRAPALALVTALAGCSFLVDTTALTGGDASDGGGDGSAATPEGGSGDGAPGRDGALPSADAGPPDTDAAGGAAYAQAVTADGPLAYWRLRETSGTTAKDETGRHDGTWHVPPLFDRPGPFPGATSVRLSGSQAFSADSLAGASAYSGVTYEGWASVASNVASINWIFAFDEPDAARPSAGVSHSPSPGSVFRYHDPTVGDLLGQTTTQVDVFYYVVVTIDASGVTKLYVNGAVEGTTSTTSRPPSPGRFTVGANLDVRDGGAIVESEHWSGSLAELAVYDKPLSDAQIAAHYAAAH